MADQRHKRSDKRTVRVFIVCAGIFLTMFLLPTLMSLLRTLGIGVAYVTPAMYRLIYLLGITGVCWLWILEASEPPKTHTRSLLLHKVALHTRVLLILYLMTVVGWFVLLQQYWTIQVMITIVASVLPLSATLSNGFYALQNWRDPSDTTVTSGDAGGRNRGVLVGLPRSG